MAEVEKINDKPNSCEISVNAKNMWSGKVKVYSETIEESMKLALEKAEQLDQEIRKRNS